jgi:uncharacterized protein YjiS (DUF1127 family)
MLMVKIRNIRWTNQWIERNVRTVHTTRVDPSWCGCILPLPGQLKAEPALPVAHLSMREGESRTPLLLFVCGLSSGFARVRPKERRLTMTTFDHSTSAIHFVTRPALVKRAMNAISAYYRAWKNRREFYQLGNMTDAELADIGLTRVDLYVAINSPFDFDPTTRLGAIAQVRARECLAREVA